MQRRMTLIALSYLLSYCMSYAQIVSNGTNALVLNKENHTNFFAPIVNPPDILSDGDRISFSWSKVQDLNNCDIEYEFNLYHVKSKNTHFSELVSNEALLSVRTKDDYYIHNNHLFPLSEGEQYLVVINTHLLFDDYSEKLDGTDNALFFEYTPKCIAPEKIKVVNKGADNFKVLWDGPDATIEGVNYLFRYREMESNHQWVEIMVTEGTSVELKGLDNNFQYEIEVKKICPSVEDEPELHSDWVGLDNIALPSSKSLSLPAFTCGEAFVPAPCNGPPVTDLTKDTLFIGGFPILVEELFTGASAEIIYGTGWVPLPFGDQVVKVTIGSPSDPLWFNADGEICSGTVRGISDDPQYLPNLTPAPVPWGGQICVPPPTSPGFDENGIHNVTGLPWDENGFGPDSLYAKQPPYEGYQQGDPIDTTGQYDPWGFDSEGNHMSGGTTNELGCTQEKMQENPQIPPCVADPYAWVDSTGTTPTQAGITLANDVADSLQIWLDQILANLETEMDDSIAAKGPACGAIRTTMNNQVTTLGYDKKYIFGANDEYINEGMYKKFTSKPEPLGVNIERNATQEALEKNHIYLYECDKALHVFKDLKSIYTDLKTNGLTDLANDMKELIKRFTEEEATKYTNRDSLYTWLQEQVIKIAGETYEEQFGSLGYYDGNFGNGVENMAVLNRKINFNPSHGSINNNGVGNYLAINESELNQALFESFDLTPEDIVFQYKQGWQEINGVNRAYYLEAIENARNRFDFFPTNMLTENDSTLMPIVLGNRGSDGRLYKVYLDNIVFTPTSATLDAFIIIEFPHNGQEVVFQSLGVIFTPKGPQLAPLKLQLGANVDMRLSNAAKLTLVAGANTFVAVDCSGFAGIGVEADVEVCRDKVVPLDESTLEVLPEPRRVQAHFQVFMPTWSDLYLQLSIDPFAINGLEDVKWQLDSLVFDFSDTQSPAGSPPQGYQSTLAGAGGFQNAWKGFYMANLSVTLPNEWSSGNQITIAAQDVVIDNMGFSGHVSANNILTLDDGNAGGWAFSVDQFELTVIANDFENVSLNGLIHVPIISNANNCSTGAPTADDCFPYDAYVEAGGNFHFDITMPQDSFCVDMWKAGRVNIDPCSSLKMKLVDGDFDIKATLSGSIEVNGDLGGGKSFNIPEITFQNVEVGNKDPYFSPGTWEFPNELGVDFGGFAMSITDLKMVETDSSGGNNPALSFGAGIELSSKVDLSANGGFLIIGEMVTVNGKQRWKLKDVEVKGICIDGSFPGVKYINGCINFYEDDPSYGSGFRGGVAVEFEKFDGSVQAVAQFGKMPSYKYFFVDALFCGTIPVGPLEFKGLGGGVYHHMNRPASGAGLPACAGTPSIPPGLGQSLSGITYTPDASKGLGLKMTVAMALGNERAFNANATFEVLFNDADSDDGSGISDMWLYGNGRMMADLELSGAPTHNPSGSPPNNAPFSCNVDLHMSFNEGFFHGTLDAYLNTSGIQGGGAGGRVGQAEIHLESGKWYIKMGKPYYGSGVDERFKMKASIPGFGNIAQFSTYLQIGTDLDPIPPLPKNIQELTGLGPIAFVRDGMAVSGNGFVFGAEMNLGGRNYDWKIFEAKLAADLGFDVSIMDYGSGALCSNTNSQLGINGWYAMGQVYAGLEVGVDVKVKVFGKHKRFTIFDMALAAALQAQLPNPFYARGGVGGNYRLLGGLVKGDFQFDFELGERCELTGASTPYENVPIIERIVPADSSTMVPVDVEPIIYTNFPLEEPISLVDFDGNGVSYTIIVDSAKIEYREWDVPVEWGLNADRNQLTLSPTIFLPANDTFYIKVGMHVDSNGISIHQEAQSLMFTTGPGVNFIKPTNVAGSYPLDGQYNFYKNEMTNGKGYIQLEKGQPDLFFEEEETDMMIRFEHAGDGCIAVPLEYQFFENKIEFNLPLAFLQNEEIYQMDLIEVPIESNGYEVDPCNPPPSSGSYSFFTPKNPINKQYAGGNGPPVVKVKYSAYFRVSEYNRFADKMDAWMNSVDNSLDFVLKSDIEPFDKFEMGMVEGVPRLIEISALLDQTHWYNNTQAISFMYDNIQPCKNFFCLERNTYHTGYPPTRNVVKLRQRGISPNSGYQGLANVKVGISSFHFQSNALPGEYQHIGSRLEYKLPPIVKSDFNEYKGFVEEYLDDHSADLKDELEEDLGNQQTPVGDLPWKMLYVLSPTTFNEYDSKMEKYFELYFDHSLSVSTSHSFPVLVKYRMPGLDKHSTEKKLHLQW